MYCVVVHYKTAAAAAVEEHQPVLDQKQTQLPKTTCKLEAALRQPLGRLNRRPPAEKLLSTSSSFTTYIKLWTQFGCKKRQGFPSRRGRVYFVARHLRCFHSNSFFLKMSCARQSTKLDIDQYRVIIIHATFKSNLL